MTIVAFSVNTGSVLQELKLPSYINSLDDTSRALPQGVYSTFRTVASGRKVLGLKAHFKRLYDPSKELGVTPTITSEGLRLVLRKLLANYQTSEARVRICLSLTDQPGQVFVIVEPLKLLGDDVYKKGVRVIISMIERTDPRIKSTGFIQKSSPERSLLMGQGVFEALMVHNGQIFEGFTSNFYALTGNKIITARQGILLGVTRKAILRLTRSIGVPIDYRALRLDELPLIDEAFISSSSRGVVPVVKINGILIGQGRPGPFTLKIQNLYEQYIQEKAEFI